MSRIWTPSGMILTAIVLLIDLAWMPSPIALVAHIVVLLYFSARCGESSFSNACNREMC